MKEAAQWFQNEGALKPEFETISDSEVAPTGDRMILVYGDKEDTLWMLKLAGPPPAEPVSATECFAGPKGKFVDPTWRSDGGELYWQEDDGVWAAPIASATSCSAEPSLLIPGAREPDASPAALAPGPRPGCGNPGNPAACPVGGGPGPGPGSGSSPLQALLPLLVGLVKADAKSLSRLALHGLRRRGRFTISLTSPVAGTLAARLLARSGRRTTVLAEGRRVYGAAGKGSLTLALTRNGRSLLARSHTLRATLKVSFTERGAAKPSTAQRALTLR